MNEAADLLDPNLDGVQLIDHRVVTWSNVRQTDYWLHKHFHYAYPGPVRELRQRLIVVPPDRYGDQRLREYRMRVAGAQAFESSAIDVFGNRVLSFYLPEVPGEVSFDVTLKIERAGYPDVLPRLDAAHAARFLPASPLTAADKRIAQAARDLAAEHPAPEALADAIMTWVWQNMRYGWGATSVSTTASEALALGQGLCQDYAQIMLAICRAAGLPARYVSGHLLGEGGSHAWVEVLLPADHGSYVAVPFDPTNHRRASLSYITIAVGCDYRDVSPTSGSFIAPYQGQLTARKRAGLTRIEYAAV
ncbi:MAG TPA: transglutaminase family protein [Roseiflexaceae bacterium]|nr:transglutaminase family protein [Roseiflexaceae bacterium]